MLRFLCPQAAAPLHIPQTGSRRILRRGSQFAAATGPRPPDRTATVSVHVLPTRFAVHAEIPAVRSPSPFHPPVWVSPRTRRQRRRRNRHHHLQLRAARRDLARVLSADSRPGRAQRDGGARLRAGARRSRREDQAGPLAAVVHRRRGAHRSDHGHVHFADGSGHARARAEFPVRSREHAEAAAQVHRQADHRGQAERQQRHADHRHAALGDRRHRAARHRRLYLLAAGVHVGALSGSARRPQHAPDAGVGHPVAGRRHAQGARHLPDRWHHLVGRLQPHLQRRRGRQQRPARSVGLGQHHQPVRRHLSGREAQAHRRRREPRAAGDGRCACAAKC